MQAIHIFPLYENFEGSVSEIKGVLAGRVNRLEKKKKKQWLRRTEQTGKSDCCKQASYLNDRNTICLSEARKLVRMYCYLSISLSVTMGPGFLLSFLA